MLSEEAQKTVERALGLAQERGHGEATVEHLLQALTEDADARPLLAAIDADLERLNDALRSHLDREPAGASSDASVEAGQSESLERTLQRAAIHVQSSVPPEAGPRSGWLSGLLSRLAARGAAGRRPRTSDRVTGADLLIAIFSEQTSEAVRILKDQGIERPAVITAHDFPRD